MRKIVVSQFVSLDGVMQGPGPEPGFDRAGWAFRFQYGEDGQQFKFDEVMAADALLLGRVTYEGFAAAWPSMTDEAGFADKMNSMPKYVVSGTLTSPEWNNTTVLEGDVATAVTGLKEGPAGIILVNGSARLVQALAAHDLVDEYRLMVFPTVVGAGKRLFAESEGSADLRLVDSRPLGPDGIVALTYEPRR